MKIASEIFNFAVYQQKFTLYTGQCLDEDDVQLIKQNPNSSVVHLSPLFDIFDLFQTPYNWKSLNLDLTFQQFNQINIKILNFNPAISQTISLKPNLSTLSRTSQFFNHLSSISDCQIFYNAYSLTKYFKIGNFSININNSEVIISFNENKKLISCQHGLTEKEVTKNKNNFPDFGLTKNKIASPYRSENKKIESVVWSFDTKNSPKSQNDSRLSLLASSSTPRAVNSFGLRNSSASKIDQVPTTPTLARRKNSYSLSHEPKFTSANSKEENGIQAIDFTLTKYGVVCQALTDLGGPEILVLLLAKLVDEQAEISDLEILLQNLFYVYRILNQKINLDLLKSIFHILPLHENFIKILLVEVKSQTLNSSLALDILIDTSIWKRNIKTWQIVLENLEHLVQNQASLLKSHQSLGDFEDSKLKILKKFMLSLHHLSKDAVNYTTSVLISKFLQVLIGYPPQVGFIQAVYSAILAMVPNNCHEVESLSTDFIASSFKNLKSCTENLIVLETLNRIMKEHNVYLSQN